MDWIQDYTNYTQSQESPEIFHRWAAITAIAGVVSRNVLLRRRSKHGVEFFRTWPGQVSVVLVAGAGRCKKSTAVNLISDILRESGAANLYDGKITPEQLLHKMANLTVPHLTLVAEELSAFLTKTSYNDGLVDILNKLIDGSNNPYETRRYSGPKAIKLTNPSLTMLSATTPSNLAKAILPQAIGHGYSSRQIYVYSEDPGCPEPMAYANGPDPAVAKYYSDLKQTLIIRLKAFANLRGEFYWTQDAATWYQDWYTSFKASPASFGEGWPQRIPDHVIRIALCLSIARGSTSLDIIPSDLSSALSLVENVNSNMSLVFAYVGQHPNSERQNKLLQIFRDANAKLGLQTAPVGMDEIYTRTIKYYPSRKDLIEDLQFLTNAGVLEMMNNPKGPIIYTLMKEP